MQYKSDMTMKDDYKMLRKVNENILKAFLLCKNLLQIV